MLLLLVFLALYHILRLSVSALFLNQSFDSSAQRYCAEENPKQNSQQQQTKLSELVYFFIFVYLLGWNRGVISQVLIFMWILFESINISNLMLKKTNFNF